MEGYNFYYHSLAFGENNRKQNHVIGKIQQGSPLFTFEGMPTLTTGLPFGGEEIALVYQLSTDEAEQYLSPINNHFSLVTPVPDKLAAFAEDWLRSRDKGDLEIIAEALSTPAHSLRNLIRYLPNSLLVGGIILEGDIKETVNGFLPESISFDRRLMKFNVKRVPVSEVLKSMKDFSNR